MVPGGPVAVAGATRYRLARGWGDCAGFNRTGFDCGGFNCAGFNLAGALMRRMAVVLWSAFLVAIVAEGVVFSCLDPMAVFPGERQATLPPLAVYTLGFFLFWLFGGLAALLSAYLLAQPAGRREPPGLS